MRPSRSVPSPSAPALRPSSGPAPGRRRAGAPGAGRRPGAVGHHQGEQCVGRRSPGRLPGGGRSTGRRGQLSHPTGPPGTRPHTRPGTVGATVDEQGRQRLSPAGTHRPEDVDTGVRREGPMHDKSLSKIAGHLLHRRAGASRPARDRVGPDTVGLDDGLALRFADDRVDPAEEARLAEEVAEILPLGWSLTTKAKEQLHTVSEHLGGEAGLLDWLDRHPGLPRLTARLQVLTGSLDRYSEDTAVVEILRSSRAEEPLPEELRASCRRRPTTRRSATSPTASTNSSSTGTRRRRHDLPWRRRAGCATPSGARPHRLPTSRSWAISWRICIRTSARPSHRPPPDRRRTAASRPATEARHRAAPPWRAGRREAPRTRGPATAGRGQPTRGTAAARAGHGRSGTAHAVVASHTARQKRDRVRSPKLRAAFPEPTAGSGKAAPCVGPRFGPPGSVTRPAGRAGAAGSRPPGPCPRSSGRPGVRRCADRRRVPRPGPARRSTPPSP